MSAVNNRTEKFSFQLWGLKFESVNPGAKTILLLSLFLIFCVILILLLKSCVLPGLAVLGSKKLKAFFLKMIWKGSS